MLSPFTNQWEPVTVGPSVIPFGIPPVQEALKALMNAGNEAMAWIQQIGAIEGALMSMGFVNGAGGATKAPFDYLADTLRGSRGIMVDMYRRPDMVLKAMERIIPIAIKSGAGGATMQRNPVVFLPLHRGADGFMSDEQFRKFYWPQLKEVLVGLINEGCVPALFCEGSYNSRLEYLKELPKASTLWIFDRSDMAKIKKLLGKTITIAGNVPAGLIVTGTADEVKAYCKNLIDVVGKDGGYIMANGTSMDEGKPETVHAMIDFTKEYGVYK
jgi:uroporphyrinogen-III decarboxylase